MAHRAGPRPFASSMSALWRHAERRAAHWSAATALLTGSQLLRWPCRGSRRRRSTRCSAATLDRCGAVDRAHWCGVYLLSWVLHGPGRMLERNVGVRVRETLADALYARTPRAPLAWHDGHHSGELQHRVHQASRALSDFAQNQFVYLQNIDQLRRAAGGADAAVAQPAACVALVGYVLIALVILRFDRALMRLARAENDADRRYVAGAARLHRQRLHRDRPAAAGRFARGCWRRRMEAVFGAAQAHAWCSTRASGSRST